MGSTRLANAAAIYACELFYRRERNREVDFVVRPAAGPAAGDASSGPAAVTLAAAMTARGDLPPHQPNCLGCGPENAGNMGLAMRREGDSVIGTTTLDRRHEGAIGFAHGGALATLLDDAMGKMLYLLERPAVTAHLEVDYRSPAYLGRPLTVTSWSEGAEGRKIWLAARIESDGVVVAEGRGLFVEVDVEHFLKGQVERGEPVRDPERLPW